MGRFINPFTDWGFKQIFGREITKDLLISFLNDLFDGKHHVTDLTFLDKEQLPEAKDMRGVVYDIYCKTADGKNVIVEMQTDIRNIFLTDHYSMQHARWLDKVKRDCGTIVLCRYIRYVL